MKNYIFSTGIIMMFIFLTLIFSCKEIKVEDNLLPEIKNRELQSIIDSSQVKGAILIFDQADNIYYSNNFEEAKKNVIPASTYKIPHSIIGLEAGVLKNERTIFSWDGNERALPIWEKDLSLKEAFQKSCVPCYQELARKIGVERMKKYLDDLNFGLMDVNHNNIDNFWLIGESKINPFQQIGFLKRLYNNELKISKSTNRVVKKILKIEENEGIILSGKTGLGINPNGDIGWFVGYVEKDSRVYYFATRINPINNDLSRNRFINLRKKITIEALKVLNIIE